LSIINFTWTELGSNLCLRGDRMASKLVSHGTDFEAFNINTDRGRKKYSE